MSAKVYVREIRKNTVQTQKKQSWQNKDQLFDKDILSFLILRQHQMGGNFVIYNPQYDKWSAQLVYTTFKIKRM